MSDRSDPDRDREFKFGVGDGDGADELRERGPLEPGDPSLENVFFVLVGAAGTIALLLSAL